MKQTYDQRSLLQVPTKPASFAIEAYFIFELKKTNKKAYQSNRIDTHKYEYSV